MTSARSSSAASCGSVVFPRKSGAGPARGARSSPPSVAPAARRAGGGGHQAAAQQALEVDDEVERAPPQLAKEAGVSAGGATPACADGAAVEGDGFVQVAVAAQQRLVGAIDHPGDVGGGVA